MKKHKKCVIKRKLKFEDYRNCLKATQLENKINHPEKNKIDMDNLKEGNEEFIKKEEVSIKIISKIQKQKP